MKKAEKTLIFTATYNEAGNIEKLTSAIFQFAPNADLLVVDDNSPDGTGRLLDSIAKKNKKIHVIHRAGKEGLGTAHLLAMRYAVEKKYDVLITMDADFSHDPKYLPTMLELIKKYDFVIGSRYMKGGGLGYGLVRTFISRSANWLSRLLLSIKLTECTTSYRAFRRDLLEKIMQVQIQSSGYSFFFEMVYVITRLTSNITEFPIYFPDRVSGKSKISKSEIFRGLVTLFHLFWRRLFR